MCGENLETREEEEDQAVSYPPNDSFGRTKFQKLHHGQ